MTAVDCGPLSDPVDGTVDTSSGTTFMQRATYSCNVGYDLIGENSSECQETGHWSLQPVCTSEYIIIL